MPSPLTTTRRLDATQDPPNSERTVCDRRGAGRVGKVLCGKWHVDALLGVGGMATVYAATHRNGRRAALKLLHAAAARDQDVVTRFLREGYVANAVGHPGAVGVLDDDLSDDGTAILVMELLEGETLDARLERDGIMSVDDALAIADELCDVLAAAHDKGIVHRDVKPDNVFLERDGRVRLLDFGIARLREADRNEDATRTGLVMGTPAFMPPEQIRGASREMGPWTDIWAVGAILFYALSGRHVHDADNAADMMMAVAFEAAPPLSEHAPEVPRRVAEIVDRALRFDPAERWSDAREMQRAIRDARESLWRRAPDPLSETVRMEPPPEDSFELGPTDHGSFEPTPSVPPPSQPSVAPTPPAFAAHIAPARTEKSRLFVATAAAVGMLVLKIAAACVVFGQLCAVAAPAARDVRDPVVLAAAQE